ncbi:MAG: ribosome small subunit-dependent GTPase A, partial [Candidatus Kapaibacterium sp.]
RDKATGRGRVVGTSGAHWLVADDGTREGVVGEYTEVRECHPAGLVVSGGDHEGVVVAAAGPDTHHGVILEVEKRTGRLLRKTAGYRSLLQCLASNVEYCVIVQSAAEPFYNRRLIDRYLVAIEFGGMKPVVVVNKIELMVREAVEQDLRCYVELGIPVVYCSCMTGEGLGAVRSLLEGTTAMLAGPSGVGKSSLVNACFGLDLQKVREISSKYDKGKHTTTGARLFGLAGGGCLVDTPGIREFAVSGIHIDDLCYFFHDFDAFYQDCKYLPCSHTHEPGCNVRSAVEQGLIDAGRYDSYLRLRESMQA